MKNRQDEVINFMHEYFQAYNEYAQIENSQHLMDKFYPTDFCFDDGSVTGRDQWYKKCLTHPAIQDKLTVDMMFYDEKKNVVLTLLETHAIERATGKVLLELSMCARYRLGIDPDNNLKIAGVHIFLDTNFAKISQLSKLYAIK
jgi:hypothetical protein